jgi:hypothetical protein
VVLEVVNASRITAKGTEGGAEGPWNLASAGRYQGREGMVAGKKLKKVVLEFQEVKGTLTGFLLSSSVLVGLGASTRRSRWIRC